MNVQSVVSILRYRSCKESLDRAYEKHIPYAVIKGEPLSVLAYGTPGQRISGDIDILTSRQHLDSFKTLLSENGFQSRKLERKEEIFVLSASHQTSPWRKRTSFGVMDIDLNFDIFWGEYSGKRILIDDFISDFVEMEIYGQKIKTLPPLKAMVQLILHHYKEMNSLYHLTSHNCIRRSMFQDVYFLWRNNQEAVSLERLEAAVREYDIVPYTFYILHYTNIIYQDEILKAYVERLRTREGENLLDYYGLAEKERKKWKFDFRTRLETENIYSLIREDLTEADIAKLEWNKRIFS